MENKKTSGYIVEAVVLAVAIVLSLPLRTVQYYSVIEHFTGFYTQLTGTIILLYVIMGASFLYFMISAFAKRKKYELETEKTKKSGVGIISFFCGASVMFSAYQEYMNLGKDTSAYTVSAVLSDDIVGTLFYAQEICALLTAAYFILIGISFVTGKTTMNFQILSLTPIIWNMLRLATRFMRTVSFIRVSDLMFEMFMLCFFILFFVAYAQGNAKINYQGNEWKIAGYGLSAALLGFIVFVPRFVLTVTGNQDCMFILSRADYSDFALAIFAVATVLTRMAPKKPTMVEVSNQG